MYARVITFRVEPTVVDAVGVEGRNPERNRDSLPHRTASSPRLSRFWPLIGIGAPLAGSYTTSARR
jgi:hypothetical protein